jgi:hypothetical protein
MSKSLKLKGKLTALKIASLEDAGFYRDPETVGLYVQVSHRQRGDKHSAEYGVVRSWVYRFKSPVTGKERWMGLGSCDCVPMAGARQDARWARNLVQHGVDPVEARNAEKAERLQAAIREKASLMTFRMCVEQCLPSMIGKSKNERHRQQVTKSLRDACKAFGDVAVGSVDTPMIVKFLTPIWAATPVTADRTRDRVETVLDWAKVHKFREGENPAAWKGNLEHAGFNKPGKH